MKNLLAEIATVEMSVINIKKMMDLDTSSFTDAIKPTGHTAEDVASHMDVIDVASHIDVSDVAAHLDVSDVASHIDVSDVASNIEVDASDVASHVDMDELADHIDKDTLAQHIEFDYDTLACAVSTRAIAREIDAGDIAAELDSDDIARELSCDDRFIDRCATMLMKNEGFIAAIAAKVLAGLVAPHINAVEEVDPVPHGQRDTFIPDPVARLIETMPTVALACGHDSLNADMRCTTCGAEA
jgi:hypothetical protein